MSALNDLDQPPSDNISSLAFSPSGNKLAVAAWDCSITIYNRTPEAEAPFAREASYTCRAPVLDLCFGQDDDHLYSVGLDCDVRDLSKAMQGGEQEVLTTHRAASNKVVYSKEHNTLLSTSWDQTLHVHNLDGPSYLRVSLPAKPFAMAVTPVHVVIAMAERKVSVWEIANLKQIAQRDGFADSAAVNVDDENIHNVAAWQERESSLKFMTRAIACMPNGTGFATSSIEGRVGVEWFDPEAQKNMYAFKCHRQTVETVMPGQESEAPSELSVVYPVNALAFHPGHGTFATGGGDGVVALWDAQTKRRIRQYQKLGASIAALDFSPDGKFLAIAVSPGFEDGTETPQGVSPGEAIKVVVRTLGEAEAKGKPPKK